MTVHKVKASEFRCSKHGTFYATGPADKVPPCFRCIQEPVGNVGRDD